MVIPLFYLFSKPWFLTTLFWQYWPIEIPDKHKDKLKWQSYFCIFKGLKKSSIKYLIYKQHQAEIRSKIKTILSIERSWNKNKHFKWKTWWLKGITSTKSIHYFRGVGASIDNPLPSPLPYMGCLPFLQENLDPGLLWFFQKSQPPINKTCWNSVKMQEAYCKLQNCNFYQNFCNYICYIL